GKSRQGWHRVDLAALAGAEDAADVDGGAHDLTLGSAEGAPGELALVITEQEDERGHLFQGVDAQSRHRAVGRATVDSDLQPNDPVVPAADMAGLATFH